MVYIVPTAGFFPWDATAPFNRSRVLHENNTIILGAGGDNET